MGRRFRDLRVTSAYPPGLAVKADIRDRQLRAKTGHEQLQQGNFLLDHLVGKSEQSRRDVEPERLGRFQIEHELELGGLDYR